MVGIYCRVSRDKENSKSIENQERDGINFANFKGWKYQIYTDRGISGGAKIEDRPAFNNLVKDIEDGKIQAIYVWNNDRTARQESTWFFLVDLILNYKIQLFENGELIDLENPSVSLVQGIKALVNANFRRVTSKKIKQRLLQNVKEGKAHAKILPMGYKKDARGFLVIDENEKPIVEKIFSMCLDGNGSTTIKHWLNENNVPTRYNKMEGSLTVVNNQTRKKTTRDKKDIKWSDKTIQDILRNTIYKGKRKWNNKYYDCPAIFDSDYWEMVQIAYKSNAESNGNNVLKGKNVDHLYLLKGLLECQVCLRNFYGRTRKNKKDNYYMCSSKRHKELNCGNRSINIDVLDSFIWETMFEENTLYKKMVQLYKEGGTEAKRLNLIALIGSHQKNIIELNKDREKMVKKVLQGILEDGEVAGERQRILKAKNHSEKCLKNDKEELYKLQNETRILEDISMDFGFDINNNFFKENPEVKQKIIDNKTRRARKKIFKPSFNEKKVILKKYIKRIYLEYDFSFRVYIIRIEYNLPIEKEIYLIDSNYIYGYNYKTKDFTKWFFEYGRTFTVDKTKETYNLLKGIKLV